MSAKLCWICALSSAMMIGQPAMRHCRTLLFLFWALASHGETITEFPDYNIRLWQIEEGLPHNIVQAITQTADGYLWVGTREGLARFDGIKFQKISLMPERPLVSVSELHQDRDGVLWIGTEESGLFSLTSDSLKRYKRCDGAINYPVHELVESSDGSIWFTSLRQIYRCSQGTMEESAKLSRIQTGLCTDQNKAAWFVDSGLLRLDFPASKIVAQKANPSLFGRSIFCDPDGTFWVGTDGNLVKVYQGQTTPYRKGDGPLGKIGKILRDSSGVLWVGSYGGLSRFQNGQFIGLGEPYRIYALYEDREKNLWVGSEEGLSCVTPKMFRTITQKDGLSFNTVVSVCASRDGSIWISSWGGGLNHLVDGKITTLTASNGLSSDYIMAMTEGHDGSLWAGADYHGALNRYNKGNIAIYGREAGFKVNSSSATTALYEDENSVLWIGSRESLQCWDGKHFSTMPIDDGTGQDTVVNAIVGGSNGEIWIGTDGGLRRLQSGLMQNCAKTNPALGCPILSLYRDEQGCLWCGTKGSGLLRLKGNGSLEQFTSSCGLFSDVIYSVLEDDQTNLWLNSSRGIFRVEKTQLDEVANRIRDTLTSIHYGKADGILSSGQYHDVTQPAACKSRDGRLWFRTTQGVTVVDPKKIKKNVNPPPVVIQEVLADHRPINAETLTLDKHLVVRPGRGDLEIRYGALSYSAPEKNRFRYRMLGVNPNWVEVGFRRISSYSNLRPGKYRFEVIACNESGIWSNNATSIDLTLEPHLWQTWWFTTLLILTAIGMVAGLSRYITWQRIQRKLVRLQYENAVERERTRIARDMHDELGAKLTRVSFQGDIAKRCAGNSSETQERLAKISETARDLILSLDQIVWAVAPENDSLENLANYICRYLSDVAADSPIECKLKIPIQLPACRLSTEIRHNVFLSVKEAVNNAFKHSGATEIVITMTIYPKSAEITITDNGHGIPLPPASTDAARPKRTGRGLTNLRERMASIHGTFAFESTSKGTTVHLTLPLPNPDERSHTFI